MSINTLNQNQQWPQNLSLYAQTYIASNELQENNRSRREFNYFLHRLDVYIVNPLTDVVTDKIAMCALKKLYSFLGAAMKRLNNSRARKIADAWYDPVSTETLIRLAAKIQSLSCKWATRKSIQMAIIRYPDSCSIVAARQMYILAKDAQLVLGTSQQLRDLTTKVYNAANEEIIQPFTKDQLAYGLSIVQNANSCPANENSTSNESQRVQNSENTDNQQESQTSYWNSFKKKLNYSYEVGRGYTIAAASKVEEFAGPIVLNALHHNLHAKIIRNEKIARQEMVGKVVHSTCRFAIASTVSSLIRGGAILASYKLLEEVIVVVLPHEDEKSREISQELAHTISLGATVAGTILWLRCLAPTASRIYRAYDQNFDREASTVQEIASLVDPQINSFANTVQSILYQYFPNNTYLNNFTKRVANLT